MIVKNDKGREAEVKVHVAKHSCDTHFESGTWLDDCTECTERELLDLEASNQISLAIYDMENGGGWRD